MEEKKGLCITCVNNKVCIFPGKFPVFQCEEFSDYEPRPKKLKDAKPQRMKFDEEPTVREQTKDN